MFTYDKDDEVYIAEIEGLTFCCEEIQNGSEATVKKLVEAYQNRFSNIVSFMLPELEEFYGNLTIDEVVKNLGKATINLDNNQVTYAEQTLDNTHIFCYEFDDNFNELYYFSIDG